MRTAPAAPTALRSNDPCWCGSGRSTSAATRSSTRPGPARHDEPEAGGPARDRAPALRRDRRRLSAGPEPQVKTPDVIERMRAPGRIRRRGPRRRRRRGRARRHDRRARRASATRPASRAAATRARCNYNGFPKSLCTSVNEVICHGIPDDRALVDGDIVNLDVTVVPRRRARRHQRHVPRRRRSTTDRAAWCA